MDQTGLQTEQQHHHHHGRRHRRRRGEPWKSNQAEMLLLARF